MRFLIKLAILGLAAFGAQRLYGEFRPRVDELRGRTGSDLRDVARAVRSGAEDLRDDVKIAAMQVHDDVAETARDLKGTAEDLSGSARGRLVELTLHEPVAQTHHAVTRVRKQAKHTGKQARRRAADTMDAARGIDLHEPMHVAKVAATKSAKRAVKRAGKEAAAAAASVAARKSRRVGRRVVRTGVMVVVAGALLGVAVVVFRRMRAASAPGILGPDTFSDANVRAPAPSEGPAQQSGSGNGADPLTRVPAFE